MYEEIQNLLLAIIEKIKDLPDDEMKKKIKGGCERLIKLIKNNQTLDVDMLSEVSSISSDTFSLQIGNGRSSTPVNLTVPRNQVNSSSNLQGDVSMNSLSTTLQNVSSQAETSVAPNLSFQNHFLNSVSQVEDNASVLSEPTAPKRMKQDNKATKFELKTHNIKTQFNKFSQYRHAISKANNTRFEDVKIEQMSDLFLNELVNSKMNKEALDIVKNLPVFSDERDCCDDDIFLIQSWKNSLINVFNCYVGDYLNRYMHQRHENRSEFVKRIAKVSNERVIESYSRILQACNCAVCRLGLDDVVNFTTSGKNNADHHCYQVNHLIDNLRNLSANNSCRSLEKYMKISRNLNPSLKSDDINLYTFRAMDMPQANFLDLFETALPRILFNNLSLQTINVSFPNLDLNTFSHWEKFVVNKNEVTWTDGDSFVHQNINYRLYGLDAPELCTSVIYKHFTNELTGNVNLNNRGKVISLMYLGLNAWKHAIQLKESCDSMYLLCSPSPNEQGRKICKVFFTIGGKDIDYGLSLLQNGLAFPYASFSINSSYLEASQKAKQAKLGMFVLPDGIIKSVLPWEYRKTHSEHRNRECDKTYQVLDNNLAYSVYCSKYQCEKDVFQFNPLCCCRHLMNNFVNVRINVSTLPGSGFGLISDFNEIKAKDIICIYADYSTHLRNPDEDSDYLVDTRYGKYDGKPCKLYHKGPLANDSSINQILNELQILAQDPCKEVFLVNAQRLLEGEEAKKIEENSANAEFYAVKNCPILFLRATKEILRGEEIFVSYGLKGYWYPLLKTYLENKNHPDVRNLQGLFSDFKNIFDRFPELEKFIKESFKI